MSTTLEPKRIRSGAPRIDVSVVMPCLDEEASVGGCVHDAFEGIRRCGLTGEVVVCDNGSSDRSVATAREAGARVVLEQRRGYGRAYRTGLAAATGRYLVMGDADRSYDFTQLESLVAPLLDGYDYVLGSRRSGMIRDGAMPWLHRYIGNPVLTGVLHRLFGIAVSDAHSGMRAFTRSAYEQMGLSSDGMEFASELVIAAAEAELQTTEVPITYHPRVGESKLRSFRDGWRHLRFMLLRCPRYLYFVPGLIMLVLGLAGQLALLPGPLPLGFHALDVHFSALFALSSIVGLMLLAMGTFADLYSVGVGLSRRAHPLARAIERNFTLERGLVVGLTLFLAGFGLDVGVLVVWINRSLGAINEMRPALLAMSMMVMGIQIFFSSFLLSLIQDPP